MPLKTKYIIYYQSIIRFIYLSFAFDSLLKINVGIRIHIGILLVLLLNMYYFLFKGGRDKVFVKTADIWLLIFGIYIFFSGIMRVGYKSLFVLVYFFLAMNMFFFIRKNFHHINKKIVFKQFQILLIITGLIQFFVFLFFDYQINFLDTDHYSKISSVAIRLRGFFIEPNWYAIAISFNTFLLIGKDLSTFIKRQPILFILTILVMLLNGTFGTLIILLSVYGYKYLKKNFVIAFFLLIVGTITIHYILEGRASVKKGKSGVELFNYGSRVRPLQKVVDYLNEQGKWKWMFGEGFGSWGTLGIENRLSVLRFKTDPKFRDSSELHVFLFELGLVGTLIFFFDFVVIWFKGNPRDFHLRGALLLFMAAFLLYPIFKFWMYMPYYFYVRERIMRSKLEQI